MAARAIRLGRSVDGAGALYAPEALHAVRIAVKKLRYSLEMGRAARVIVGSARAATRLSRFQDLLGEWHDWQMLVVARLARAGRVRPSTTSTWRISRPWPLASKTAAARLHAEFMSARPDTDRDLSRRSR